MTENEFNEKLYQHYKTLMQKGKGPALDDYDLLWMAAMKCALEVDRTAVWVFCEREKPLMEHFKLQQRQFMTFKKIATGNGKTKTSDLKNLHEQFKMRLKKDGVK